MEANYPKDKTNKLIHGFMEGFDIQYQGRQNRAEYSNNIPLFVGTKVQLWNKVIKEVRLGWYAGPYIEVPYQYFLQSPIGLVPKDNNTQTRLIFHLSYEFLSGLGSVNSNTPQELCTVQYKNLDHAVEESLNLLSKLRNSGGDNLLFYGKTDVKSAFRILSLSVSCFKWLILKAREPITGCTFFFVEKNVPFRASISCRLFQEFSDCLCHIIEHRFGNKISVTNYLDDYMFQATSRR